ncbi:MAG TPA: glycerophosphodiester phosphodiesterase [Dehalococcoidia bacterium]|nr:glycerophosphodiester phosphodiesterase [Dehalococcoidia bacterium]
MVVLRWRPVPFLVGFFGMLLLLFAAADWQERALRDALYDRQPHLFFSEATETLQYQRPAQGLAHNAGRDWDSIQQALEHGASMIEFDVQYANGELRVEHSRRAPIIPRLDEGRTLRSSFNLLPPETEAFIELKSTGSRTLDRLVSFLDSIDRRRVFVASGSLSTLRFLDGRFPDVNTVYLLPSSRAANFWNRDDTQFLDGVSIGSGLFKEHVIRGFKDRGWLVFAGPVNNPETVRDLIRWSVDVINTDDLRILEALRGARIPFELFDPRL